MIAELNRSKLSRPARVFDWDCSDLRFKHRQRSEEATNSMSTFERVNQCLLLRLIIFVRVQWPWDNEQMQCVDIGEFLIDFIFFIKIKGQSTLKRLGRDVSGRNDMY